MVSRRRSRADDQTWKDVARRRGRPRQPGALRDFILCGFGIAPARSRGGTTSWPSMLPPAEMAVAAVVPIGLGSFLALQSCSATPSTDPGTPPGPGTAPSATATQPTATPRAADLCRPSVSSSTPLHRYAASSKRCNRDALDTTPLAALVGRNRVTATPSRPRAIRSRPRRRVGARAWSRALGASAE
jgi:hypothetical protein